VQKEKDFLSFMINQKYLVTYMAPNMSPKISLMDKRLWTYMTDMGSFTF
jgi:hypothetical protein